MHVCVGEGGERGRSDWTRDTSRADMYKHVDRIYRYTWWFMHAVPVKFL